MSVAAVIGSLLGAGAQVATPLVAQATEDSRRRSGYELHRQQEVERLEAQRAAAERRRMLLIGAAGLGALALAAWLLKRSKKKGRRSRRRKR